MLAGSQLPRVIPKPFRVQGRCTHRKCQPIWRIMVSKIGAVISFRRFQCSPTGLTERIQTLRKDALLAQEN